MLNWNDISKMKKKNEYNILENFAHIMDMKCIIF